MKEKWSTLQEESGKLTGTNLTNPNCCVTCFCTEQLQDVPRVFTQKLAGVLQRRRVRFKLYACVILIYNGSLHMHTYLIILFLASNFTETVLSYWMC